MPSIIRSLVPLLFAASALAGCGRADTARPKPSSSTAAAQGDTTRFTVLPASEGPRLLRSCSPTPEDGAGAWNPAGFWEPDAATAREVETRLPALLDSVLPLVDHARGRPGTLRSADYVRQYVGITRGGERLVYVHGLAEGILKMLDETHGTRQPAFDWRRYALTVCDGGVGLFGVVYDPRRGTFGRLEFSGSFGGPVTY